MSLDCLSRTWHLHVEAGTLEAHLLMAKQVLCQRAVRRLFHPKKRCVFRDNANP